MLPSNFKADFAHLSCHQTALGLQRLYEGTSIDVTFASPYPRLATSPNVRRDQMGRSETRLKIRDPYDESLGPPPRGKQAGSAQSDVTRHRPVCTLVFAGFPARKPRLLSTDSSHHPSRDRSGKWPDIISDPCLVSRANFN
jgi:hypothetical protein